MQIDVYKYHWLVPDSYEITLGSSVINARTFSFTPNTVYALSQLSADDEYRVKVTNCYNPAQSAKSDTFDLSDGISSASL